MRKITIEKCPNCSREMAKSHIPRHYQACVGNRRTYEEIYGEERAKQIREQISRKVTEAQDGSNHELKKRHSEATSRGMKEKYASGWDSTCGRAKKYDYESPSAGKIKLDGTWEVKVAQYLDRLNINWRRNTERFEYINLQGNKSTYKPDFYIKNWNSYLEIKGYETDLDRCKWSQFSHKLIVWRKQDLIDKQIL